MINKIIFSLLIFIGLTYQDAAGQIDLRVEDIMAKNEPKKSYYISKEKFDELSQMVSNLQKENSNLAAQRDSLANANIVLTGQLKISKLQSSSVSHQRKPEVDIIFQVLQSKLDSVTNKQKTDRNKYQRQLEEKQAEFNMKQLETAIKAKEKETELMNYENISLSKLFSALTFTQMSSILGLLIALFLAGCRLGVWIKSRMFDQEKNFFMFEAEHAKLDMKKLEVEFALYKLATAAKDQNPPHSPPESKE